MSKSVKAIAIIAAVVLLLGIAATIVVVAVSYDPENVKPGLYFSGERVDDPGAILTVGEHEISYDEYRFYYLSTKSDMDGGDPEYWVSDPDQSKARALRDQTEENIRRAYAWADVATELGIGLTEEEKQDIQDELKDMKRQSGTGFKAKLLAMNITTEELYIYIMEMAAVREKVSTEYEKMLVEDNADELLESVVTAKHILITFDESATDSAENEAYTLQRSEEILAEYNEKLAEALAAGPQADKDGNVPDEATWRIEVAEEIFEALRKTYDEDGGQTSAGYTFGEGTMVTEFYEGALALQVGEVSAPVRTSYGYHIILRLPQNTEDVEENRDTYLDTAATYAVNDKITGRAEGYTTTYGEYYDRILPANVK